MRHCVRVLHAVAAIAAGLLIAGCYTQFATLEEKAVSPDRTVTIIDSTGKQVTVVRRIDTVPTIDRETCIWERDLMGFPTLHCYKGYYPRQWYLYNFSPWWYRTDAYRYSADRCPPFYYYDNSCGCCRYYLNNPDALRSAAAPANNESTAGAAPATGQVAADSQDNRVNISTGSRATFYSRQRGKAEQPIRPLPSAGTTAAPSTAATSDSAGKKTDTASVPAPQQTGSGETDTAKPAGSTSTVRQNSRQDTVRVPPARQQPRRSIRGR